jgi:uncharacterized membrane protein YoaK (UPF0700 family)
MSESYLVGVLLAIVGGYLDAYTYISHGHVFANAQTGNVVLLAIKIADWELLNALYYVVPIFAFIVGTLVAEIVRSRYKNNNLLHWRQIVIILEIGILFLTSYIPQGKMDALVNVLISFVCALQIESFRKMNGITYTTTMCTGNLRSATEELYHYIKTKDAEIGERCIQYYGLIIAFIVGAGLGAWLTNIFLVKSVLFDCGLLIFVLLLLFYKNEEKHS